MKKFLPVPLEGGLIIPVEAMICLSMRSARDAALQKRLLSELIVHENFQRYDKRIPAVIVL